MWIGKIGAKSSAFINHKPFHPSNFQNLQKVWEAEEKHRLEQQRVQEILEKREEERKIQELRKALHTGSIHESTSAYEPTEGSRPNYLAVDSLHNKTNERSLVRPKGVRHHRYVEDSHCIDGGSRSINISKFQEDAYPSNHSSVWGSYYNRESGMWGFSCCKKCINSSGCLIEESSQSRRNKRPAAGIDAPTLPIFDSKLSESETIPNKKRMDSGYGRKSVRKGSQSGLADVLAKLKEEHLS